MKSISPKTAAIVIVLILIGIGAYYFWGGNMGNFSIVSTQTETTGTASDILVLSQKLKTVSIDESIFSGPLFANLVDREALIQPESQGRDNPFAQFGF